MTFQKIYVLGAGAVGSAIGGLLSKCNDVTLIGNRAHTKAVNSQGLVLTGDIEGKFKVPADTRIREIPWKTLVLLTTKAYDSEKAILGIRKLLKEDTVILVLQNGLGNEDVVERVTGGTTKVLRGVTTMAAEFFKPGEVKYWKGETIIESDAVGKKIGAIMNMSGLKTSLSQSMKNAVWRKVVVNSVINPLTAIFQVRNQEIGARTLEIARHQIVQECAQVAESEGANLPDDLEKTVDVEIRGYSNFSSMYQDIAKGKRTEIDFLNGKIVELGRKNKVPTPINDVLVHFIKFLEDKNELSRKN